MSSLLQTFNNPNGHRGEILRYFPVAVVASMDGYFRARLSQFIDAGDPFLSNAVAKYPDIKLDMQMAGALATKKVSLGELITYRVSISSFGNLIDFVRSVTGESGFPDDLAKMRPESISGQKRGLLIEDPRSTWTSLDKVFSTRHILCHEMAQDLEIDEADVRKLLLESQGFMKASSAWLESVMAKHFPIRQRDRLREARKQIGEARAHIKELMTAATHMGGDGDAVEALKNLQQAHSAYLSTVKESRRTIFGGQSLPHADHEGEFEELNSLKLFLSMLVSMVLEMQWSLERQGAQLDLERLSKFVKFEREA